MKILRSAPDGGKGSGVTSYFLIEWKGLFSIDLLKFDKGSREAFHSHAFNALTWWLKGSVTETLWSEDGTKDIKWKPSILPKFTPKENVHKITADETTWAFTIRGPWESHWYEIKDNKKILMTHGRQVLKGIEL